MSYLNAYEKKISRRWWFRLRLQFKQVLNKAVDKRKKFLHSSGYCRR
jgi:hypothetical protein